MKTSDIRLKDLAEVIASTNDMAIQIQELIVFQVPDISKKNIYLISVMDLLKVVQNNYPTIQSIELIVFITSALTPAQTISDPCSANSACPLTVNRYR